MSTGEKLRELRQKKGLSLRGLARETGVIAASILLIERGRQPRTATLRKLAKALGPYGLSLLASEVKVHMSPAMPAPTHHRVAVAQLRNGLWLLSFLNQRGRPVSSAVVSRSELLSATKRASHTSPQA